MRLVFVGALAACAGITPAPAPVRPGIEVLLADSAHLVRGRRLGLLTNHTGIDRAGRRDVDLLHAAAGVRLTVLFSPEHGFQGIEDRPGLPDAVDPATGLPIYSLYSGARPPNLAGLDSLDVLLVDLQDIGARYYTYVSTAVILMREAAARGIPVVALDRPNPVGGVLVQGNVRIEPAPPEVFVGILPVPMRHGMTLGEMLRLANDAYGVGARLTVVPAAGWRRDAYFDATGLPWVKPSPNMPDLESAIHYPGTCLFEGTNLSVGRGTPRAFQVIGAPWLDPVAVLTSLEGAGSGERPATLGVEATPTEFTPISPTDGKYDGVPLRGVRLRVTDRAGYDPTRLAVALLAAVRAVHGDSLRFRDAGFDRLAAGPGLRTAIMAGRSAEEIWAGWGAALARFRAARAKYLLY
ncbi:MAG: exo-beta-N-acetylmuramidase NamZ family protein [Gemmatimonadales bacterium]